MVAQKNKEREKFNKLREQANRESDNQLSKKELTLARRVLLFSGKEIITSVFCKKIHGKNEDIFPIYDILSVNKFIDLFSLELSY